MSAKTKTVATVWARRQPARRLVVNERMGYDSRAVLGGVVVSVKSEDPGAHLINLDDEQALSYKTS